MLRRTMSLVDERSVRLRCAPQEGYIFNLGSGILPGTPIESMEAVFSAVRARRKTA